VIAGQVHFRHQAVAGLFGMNVRGIPFAGRALGFFFIAGTLIALTGVLIYVVFGKRRD